MAALAFPTSSSPGAIPGEGSGRLINAMALKDGADTAWFPTPGLDAIAAPGVASPRGGLLVEDSLLLARVDSLFAIDAAYALQRIDGLPGSGPVTMARDNAAATDGSGIVSGGPHVVIVTESGPFIMTPAGVRPYPRNSSGNTALGQPNSVAFLDGYFVFSFPDGTIRATGTSGIPSNTLDFSDQSFTRAESSPDGLLRVTAAGGQIWAWGPASIEVYDDTASSPFPFTRSQVIPVGLFGPWCVAGWEPGWDGPQIFVAADGTVRAMSGYTAQRISTRAVERAIAAASAAPGAIRACVYTFGGNAIWSLSGPGFTWEYNATTQLWHERRSVGLPRWRAEASVRAFGRWFLGDVVTGAVLGLAPDSRVEAGAPVVARIESAALTNFPDRIRFGGLTVAITTGQGRPGDRDAACLIEWSLDGGGRWSEPLSRPIGGPGRYGMAVRVGDLGRASREGVRVAITVSDPVAFSLRGAALPNVAARRGS